MNGRKSAWAKWGAVTGFTLGGTAGILWYADSLQTVFLNGAGLGAWMGFLCGAVCFQLVKGRNHARRTSGSMSHRGPSNS